MRLLALKFPVSIKIWYRLVILLSSLPVVIILAVIFLVSTANAFFTSNHEFSAFALSKTVVKFQFLPISYHIGDLSGFGSPSKIIMLSSISGGGSDKLDVGLGNSVTNDKSSNKFRAPFKKSDAKAQMQYFHKHSKAGSHFSGNAEKVKELERVLMACRTLKSSLSLTEINHAITSAGRLGRVSDALEIFRSIPKLNFQPDLMSYNNIIWCAGHAGKSELAKELFSELKHQTSSRLNPNVYTYGALMHGCARSRDYKRAFKILDMMESDGVKANLIVFTSAIEACSESGKYKEALKIMDRMKSIGLRPDLTMINAAIKACSLAGAMDEAEGLVESLREYYSMDLFTYHTLMMGNTKLGRHYRVLALYEDALKSGAKLDGGIFSLAMLSALNSGLFHLVPRMAERARVEGIKLTEASYTTLIQSYAEAGASDLAVNCLQQMTTEGLRPNVISYAAVMAACRDKPDVVLSLLDRMVKVDRIEPNTVVLTSAINALARGGGECTDKAYQILLDMEKNGPEPNIYTYNTVVRAFAEIGKLDEAISILTNIKNRNLIPDQFTFTTLLLACGRNQSSEKVDNILQTMKNAGVMPDDIIYGAAIDAHRRSNNSARAILCLYEMIKLKLEPTPSHYNLVLRALRQEGEIDKMLKMAMSIVQKDDAKINTNTFEIVIEALLENKMWKQTLSLLNIMDKYGFKPQLQVYVSLVELLEKARQYKAVLALYKVMARDGYDFYENSVLNEVFKRLVSLAEGTVLERLQAKELAAADSPRPLEVIEDFLKVDTSAAKAVFIDAK